MHSQARPHALEKVNAAAFRTTLIAFLICIPLAVLLTTAMLSLSARVGRLSIPLAFDDISYAVEGFWIYQMLVGGQKLEALGYVLHAHAPLQTILATLAPFAFGFHEWAFYAVLSFLIVLLTVIVLLVARPLPLLPQLAIVAVVLTTPVTANLVTEFRPDLWWGFLCGIAAYLIFDPRFLRGSVAYQVVTIILSALALLGKPSGSPATAIFLGYAAVASFLLTLREEKAARRDVRNYFTRFGLYVGCVALLIGPYYLQNLSALYNYLYLGFVEQIDVFRTPGTILDQLKYYVVGQPYHYALYLTFWFGLIVFFINIVVLCISRRWSDLLRYLAYAAAVFAAYCAPTLSPIKSFFLGGIFYGTFLIFTVHGLVLLFSAMRAKSPLAMQASAALIILLALYTFQGMPLIVNIGPQEARDRHAVNDEIVAALAQELSRLPQNFTATIYVPAPDPVTDSYLTLRLGWLGYNVRALGGYYTRTMREHEQMLNSSNFVVLTDVTQSVFPGQQFSPELIKRVSVDPSYRKLVDFLDSSGRHTYLFARSGPTAIITGASDLRMPD